MVVMAMAMAMAMAMEIMDKRLSAKNGGLSGEGNSIWLYFITSLKEIFSH